MHLSPNWHAAISSKSLKLERIGVSYAHHYLKDYHALASYYHALDAYLIASWEEGGPKGLLESWASGVPVVSTYVGMPADLIRHGENGFIADVEDAVALTEHVRTLIGDPALNAACRENGWRDVQALSWTHIAARHYHTLYQPVLQEGI